MSLPRDREGHAADRVPLVRHAALSVGAVLACVLHSQLRVRDHLLWIIVAAAVLNLLASIGSERRKPGPAGRWVSTLVGLASWTVLAALTGGASSPFIAGLWVEIVLSASGPPSAVLLTTLAALGGFWALLLRGGFEGGLATALLPSAFLIGTGGITFRLTERFRRSRTRMARRIAVLRLRLARVESDLQSERFPAGGPDAAQLAHSLKNAVHSMRGFLQLLDARLASSAGCEGLLEGLRSSIDHLDGLSRLTLGPSRPRISRQQAGRVVREAVDQVAAAFPEVRWSVSGGDDRPVEERPAGCVTPPIVRDALINLLRNAAEAMHGEGEVRVELAPAGGRLVIRIRDHGPGIAAEALPGIFRPGRTTKTEGHGLGLVLTRRLLESAGGRLSVAPAEGGGLLCAVELPS